MEDEGDAAFAQMEMLKLRRVECRAEHSSAEEEGE